MRAQDDYKRPPPGFSWTSHSLRKGTASAANAIKIAINDIRCAGGWSTNSTVLEAKYIDFAMALSEAAYVLISSATLRETRHKTRKGSDKAPGRLLRELRQSLPIHTLRERHSKSSAYSRSATP